MTSSTKQTRRFTRRNLAKLVLAGAVFVPATWIAALRLKDNPLPEIKRSKLKLEGGWVLDDGDGFGNNSGNTQ